MRILPYPVFALTVAASIATAQSPQTSVDISVTASFANGAVRAQVTRKDPPGVAPVPGVKVGVSAGLKGEKPFFYTVVEMKPGSSQSVSAPFSGSSSVTVIVSAMPLDLKEVSPADNTREVSTAIIMAVPMTIPVVKTGGAKPPAPAPASKPAPSSSPAPTPTAPPSPPAMPAPAPASTPAPAPAPARTPPAATIATSSIVLVGGAVGGAPVGISGATLTTAGIVLRGGAQGPIPVAPAGMTITTPAITLIGKQE